MCARPAPRSELANLERNGECARKKQIIFKYCQIVDLPQFVRIFSVCHSCLLAQTKVSGYEKGRMEIFTSSDLE